MVPTPRREYPWFVGPSLRNTPLPRLYRERNGAGAAQGKVGCVPEPLPPVSAAAAGGAAAGAAGGSAGRPVG